MIEAARIEHLPLAELDRWDEDGLAGVRPCLCTVNALDERVRVAQGGVASQPADIDVIGGALVLSALVAFLRGPSLTTDRIAGRAFRRGSATGRRAARQKHDGGDRRRAAKPMAPQIPSSTTGNPGTTIDIIALPDATSTVPRPQRVHPCLQSLNGKTCPAILAALRACTRDHPGYAEAVDHAEHHCEEGEHVDR